MEEATIIPNNGYGGKGYGGGKGTGKGKGGKGKGGKGKGGKGNAMQIPIPPQPPIQVPAQIPIRDEFGRVEIYVFNLYEEWLKCNYIQPKDPPFIGCLIKKQNGIIEQFRIPIHLRMKNPDGTIKNSFFLFGIPGSELNIYSGKLEHWSLSYTLGDNEIDERLTDYGSSSSSNGDKATIKVFRALVYL